MDETRRQLSSREVVPASDTASFIGRGLVWPMGVDHTGAIALTRTADDIDRSIRVVLATAPGERVMRPDFGCAIWDQLFEPITDNLFGLMRAAVLESVSRWEPRVTISDVVVSADPDDVTRVQIRVSYIVKATNDARNLVYPFYVIPREED